MLEACNSCTGLSLDIQLKILQALPSLLQNYAEELKGELLASALQVCSALQGVKTPAVSGVAAATLQQLITSVYDQVASEDSHATEIPPIDGVPGDDGTIPVRAAAFDAYRVFLDLCLATEGRKTRFVEFAAVSQASGLELVYSCLDSHSRIFASHAEQMNVVRTVLFPTVIRALSEKQSFPLTVRLVRVLDLLLRKHLEQCPAEAEVGLSLATHMLDLDAAPSWKRVLMMEILRGVYADSSLVFKAFSMYDAQDGKKNVVQENVSALVRLSTEKPNAIGLGQQSSAPTGSYTQRDGNAEQTAMEAAGGVAGAISTVLGVTEASAPGISTQWSSPRIPCMDQLDKSDPSAFPETYIYSLVLDCLTSLSENLAKLILPLTVQHESAKSRKAKSNSATNGDAEERPSRTRMTRSQSFRTRAVPLNPLSLEDNPAIARVQTCASLIEACWPALLATCSTFLYASLDNDYYRALIKSYQRFAQVAGLLRLTTPRDAFMTTLGKAAVPPQVLNAHSFAAPLSPNTESPRLFSNPKGMLSVDSLVSQASGLSLDKSQRSSYEPPKPTLTTRNLLCLRALLNLAIALGPILEKSFAVVIEALKQADMILSSSGPTATQKNGLESPATLQAFSGEVSAVEAAASRLLESTADYPDEAFVNIVSSVCGLLHEKRHTDSVPSTPTQSSPPPTPAARRVSGLPGLRTGTSMQAQDYQFVLPKLGDLISLNVSRFSGKDFDQTGWTMIIEELIDIITMAFGFKEARKLACDILGGLAMGTIAGAVDEEVDVQQSVQRRALNVLLRTINLLYERTDDLSSIEIELHAKLVDALRAILEQGGESLTAGWDTTIAIAASVFQDHEDDSAKPQSADENLIKWKDLSSNFISTSVGRTSFAVVQLICSDFRNGLPKPCIGSLVELLYRFMSQDSDLNTSLTSITLVRNLSDYVFDAVEAPQMEQLYRECDEDLNLLDYQIATLSRSSGAAQWLLLLLRLRDVTAVDRAEVRNAAFQTVCSIFRNHGHQLSPAAWDLTMRSVILRIPANDVAKQQAVTFAVASKEGEAVRDETSKMILVSTADLLSQHLSAVERMPSLIQCWEDLMKTLDAYTNLKRHSVNAALYNGLANILSHIDAQSKVWTGSVRQAASIWARRVPVSDSIGDSNQEAFTAYTDTANEIYRLTGNDLTAAQIRSLTQNLLECIRQSDADGYSSDVNTMTVLQCKVADLLKEIRIEIPGVASTLLTVSSELVRMPFALVFDPKPKSNPTFIALSTIMMDFMERVIISNMAEAEIFESGALLSALEAFSVPIVLKYQWKTSGRPPAPWQKATSCAITVTGPIVQRMNEMVGRPDLVNPIWSTVVGISNGIMAGDCSLAPEGTDIVLDEDFDIANLEIMRNMLIPRLGAEVVADETRQTYTRSLFTASIIHAPEPHELPASDKSPLEGILNVRRGRVRDPPPVPRELMAYSCFSELISLTATDVNNSPERQRLARAAAPLLMLRFTLPIKAYIADQPLRGRMPQPLSEVEELQFCFQEMQTLRCDPEALAGLTGAMGLSGEKAHLRLLHPLLTQAVGVAGDRWGGNEELLTALRKTLDVAGQDTAWSSYD